MRKHNGQACGIRRYRINTRTNTGDVSWDESFGKMHQRLNYLMKLNGSRIKEGRKTLATKKLIESTVEATILKINSFSLVDRMKTLKDETFKNTEKLLYNYNALKDHINDEIGYFEMMEKRTSGSIVRYSKSKAIVNDDEMLRIREESYLRSKNDLERLERALNKVKKRKEYKVIELRYFISKKNGDIYTFEEIAEKLEKDEKTVRTWKNKLIKEISINLFGSDAI